MAFSRSRTLNFDCEEIGNSGSRQRISNSRGVQHVGYEPVSADLHRCNQNDRDEFESDLLSHAVSLSV